MPRPAAAMRLAVFLGVALASVLMGVLIWWGGG